MLKISDRGFLFVFSLVAVIASLATVVWLIATGQAGTFDGLFLLCSCLVIAFSFSLYLVFLIRRALESPAPAPAAAKAAAGSKTAGALREAL